MRPIAVVAEDKLTEAVLKKCIVEFLPQYTVIRSEVKGGRGNVQKSLGAYAKLAETMPVLVGIDLDSDECAPSLLADWSGEYQPAPGLLLRVAVREVETWVLADRRRIARFLSAPINSVPTSPEQLEDPKIALLDLARAHAGDELRRDLLPVNFGQYPRIGPAYNMRMGSFVAHRWRPHVAAGSSDSLSRAILAIQAIGA